MIFAMSDIHGYADVFENRIKQIEKYIADGDKLILLGDYIDRGRESFQSLNRAYSFQKKYGREQVIVLKGNHEQWFLDFLYENADEWLIEDDNFKTSGTFISAEDLAEIKKMPYRASIECLKKKIKENNKEILKWLKELPLYYERKNQIYVHAGVDEDIPEEELEWCMLGTGEWTMLGKFPPSKGRFFKDIIAGHVSVRDVAGDKLFKGIYYDGFSHYYIDGSACHRRPLLCLAYDEGKNIYYEFTNDGAFKEID